VSHVAIAQRGGDAADGATLVRSALARDDTPDVGEDQRAQLGESNRAFAFDLYRQVTQGSSENTFFSPYCVSLALAMTYAGAKDETKSEMMSALRFDLPEPELHAAFNAADLELKGRPGEAIEDQPDKGVRLELTNAFFVQSGRRPGDAFLDVLATNYDAGVQMIDLQGEPERSRTAINGWVADHTEDRIQELLRAGSIDASTVFVLVNAIYFKAAWMLPFEPQLTAEGAFHAPAGDVTASMMKHVGAALQYMRGDGFAAVELPYLSPAVRMMIVLPDEGRFDATQASFDRAAFDGAREQLSESLVDLTMPKFKFGSDFQLNDAEGTEAAASTAVIGVDESTHPSATMVLDRPFIFAIYDQPTGQILFLGRVLDPSDTGS